MVEFEYKFYRNFQIIGALFLLVALPTCQRSCEKSTKARLKCLELIQKPLECQHIFQN